MKRIDEDGNIASVNTNANNIGIGQGQDISNSKDTTKKGVTTTTDSEKLDIWFSEPSDPTTITNPEALTHKKISAITITFDALDGGNTSSGAAAEIAEWETFLYDATTNTTTYVASGTIDGAGTGSTQVIYTIDGDSNTPGGDTGVFNLIVFKAGDGSSYKIAAITAQDSVAGEDIGITVDALATDNDLSSDAASFNITFDALDDIGGSPLDDALAGGTGNDILTGGTGDDILTGGAGDDVFTWMDGDADSGTDTVTDFNTTVGNDDVLNLADMLDPTGSLDIGGADSLSDYLTATFDNGTGNTTIDVYLNGNSTTSGAVAEQSIIVNGDYSGTGLDTLLAGSNLVVDQ